MRIRVQHVVVALLLAALACGVLAGSAVASRSLEFAPSGAIRGVLREGQQLFIAFGRIRIRCRATLTGSIRQRANKFRDELIGEITEVALPTCETGEMGTVTMRPLFGLPWSIMYQSFSGTLPNITAIGIKIPSVRFLSTYTLLGVRILCLFEGEMMGTVESPGAVAESIFIVNQGLRVRREAELASPACGEERSLRVRSLRTRTEPKSETSERVALRAERTSWRWDLCVPVRGTSSP